MKADVKKYLVYNQLFSLIFTGSKKVGTKKLIVSRQPI